MEIGCFNQQTNIFTKRKRKQGDINHLGAYGLRVTFKLGGHPLGIPRRGTPGAAGVLSHVQSVDIVAVEEHLVKDGSKVRHPGCLSKSK